MNRKTTKLTIFVIVLGVVLFNRSMASAQPVYFADANLKLAVEDELGITDPTAADMLALTSLNAANKGIDNLTGLEYADNLTGLSLSSNQLSDLSPLSGLTNLTGLHLYYNQISDISPLSGLTKLTWLFLHNNQLSNISPLSGLTNLTELRLYNNQISDISALSGLPNLWELYLEYNPLNREAYCTYLPLIEANNPYAYVTYDPDPCGCPSPPALVGDLDENCRVNWGDFAIFANHWLQCNGLACD